ncbi:MAG: trypsin-like peptidase domain-containing protein [Chloroflexi bacterium]|nr:trypsin-like peptidase domain-containing protein [Chloroflexota bacterium]
MKRIKRKYLIVAITLILSLTLGAGCGLLPGVDVATAPPPSNPPITTSNTTPIDAGWSVPAVASQAALLPSIADVVARVKPSVVAINTEVITLDVFNRPFTQKGAGSGWIVSKDGIVITNNHVVEGAKSITVILDDGRTFPVDMNTVATDWLTDLAMLKIEAENLPAASVGDSRKLRVGDWVVAIGNSLGMGTSATTGIVSSLGVRLEVSPGQTLYDLVQTDAAINPGNSGGPLVNMAGEVIGINSVKRAQVDVEGVGYAISTNEAMPIINGLITSGYVVRPWLGVTVDNAVRYNLAVNEGAVIVNMAAASPADQAGLKVGDVITKFGDREITEVNELIRAIQSAQVGQEVAITFWRGGARNTTQATLIERPPSS